MKALFASLFAAACFVGGDVQAQQPAAAQTINTTIRGTITAFDGKVISVKTREGKDVNLDLPEAAPVAATKAITLADIKPGAVLGVTTLKRPDGTTVAIDVRPIPPAARRGLSAYDLAPGSTMTNAALEGTVAVTDGQELTLNYESGTVKVLVPPGTPMSQSIPGQRSDIKPGETLYAVATPGEDGKLRVVRMQVSKDGAKPTQ